ncbi:MAG: hydroxyacylglutathione hydrolase [Candidatus Azotimanducaceae bacterium]|jgi:hydroxyacylglutathione hydrolase
MGLSIVQVAVTGYDDNFSYLVYDVASKNAAIVDPCGDLDLILETAQVYELDIVGALVTHTHHDHIDKLDELLRMYRVPVYVHESGVDAIVSSGQIQVVQDGSSISLGDFEILVRHTPGHIDDAVCFYIDAKNAEDDIPKLVTGDTLFVEGCGRTNISGVRALYESLQRLKELPENTLVYTGHDYGSKPVSTIAWEKEHNKYFLAEDFEVFKKIRLG